MEKKAGEVPINKVTSTPSNPFSSTTTNNTKMIESINTISAGTILEGQLRLEGDLHVEGTIKGTVTSKSKVTLGANGKIEGDVNNEKITLSLKNINQFTAGMIGDASPSFQVMNPELPICTLDSSAKLDIEITIGKGRGYVPAEDQKDKSSHFGYIPVDAIYTPINNVKYLIENTRVEQRTDFEKLIMEVVTDGTIHPEEAVKQASRILIQHLMIITDENITFDNKEEKKEDLVDEQTLQLRKVLKTPLEDLDLSVRAFNCLKAAKINSLSQLVQYEQEDLMKFRNFGQKSLSEIEQVLQERGLHFGMDLAKLGIDVEEY
mgnify:CR=1 FL=1